MPPTQELTRPFDPSAAPPTDLAVQVDSLVKSYAGTRVVDEVSFTVRRGEIFGLLGANGAGKTTTVECLQRLRRPDSGTIEVLGLDPHRQGAQLRPLIGSQLQASALPDRLRVGEAIALFASGARHQGSESVEDLLTPWGLAAHRRTAFGDLSGGQRQRLFIALALLHRPQILFLDELTQGLDPSARRDVWGVIKDVRSRGTTVVLVSHFADEIEELCDRVAVFDHGRVVHTGTPAELTQRFGGPTRITFTPPPGWDSTALAGAPDVSEVTTPPGPASGRVEVRGANGMTAAVCASTVSTQGSGPADLHISHPTLHEAMLNIIGDMS